VPAILKENETSSLIRLEGVIDIASAVELKVLLLQALASGKEVCIALDGVKGLDVTAVQLLWAAGREAKASGAGFRFVGQVPSAVISSLRDAGIEDFAAATDNSELSGVTGCQA